MLSFIFGADLADKLTIGDIYYAVPRDVLLLDEADGVGWFLDAVADTVSKSSKFVG